MGATNYQMALAKRHSKLKGQLAEINATIKRIEESQKTVADLKAKSPHCRFSSLVLRIC